MERIRSDRGFGLVELLIAMTVMQIGLLAVVAAFSSGAFAINRASKTTTASVIADAQMETYRALEYVDLGVDMSPSTLAALDSTYKSDSACWDAAQNADCTSGAAGVASDGMALTGPTGSNTCSTIDTWFTRTQPCVPSRTVSGSSTPDGRSYRIDTYIVTLPATTSSSGLAQRERKQITIVVRDPNNGLHVLVRETSVFDCSSGAC